MRNVRGRPRWEQQLLKLLPILVIMFVALFCFFVSPASGFLGGLGYWIFGWMFPSLINLLAAGWLALLPRVQLSARMAIFAVASFVLGINTALPGLFEGRDLPQVESTVLRIVPLVPSLPVDDRLLVAVPKNKLDHAFPPTPLGVGIGGNEGCGCMYFVHGERGRDYYNQVQYVIRQRKVRSVSGVHFYAPDRDANPPIVHFDYETARSGTKQGVVDITVNVYEGQERVATFTQRNLPSMHLEGASLGRREALNNGHFLAYCASFLAHRNFWMVALAPYLTIDVEEAFKAFLNKTMPEAQ
jgi:hypothetical protein